MTRCHDRSGEDGLILISNAAKFTKRGIIRLPVRTLFAASVKPELAKTSGGKPDRDSVESFLTFEVSDTGPGMTPEQMLGKIEKKINRRGG